MSKVDKSIKEIDDDLTLKIDKDELLDPKYDENKNKLSGLLTDSRRLSNFNRGDSPPTPE
jgi:hypothetical protein